MEVQCEKCKSSALLARCITCSLCENHYHYECVKMNNSTPQPDWKCNQCASSTQTNQTAVDLQQLQDTLSLERKASDRRFDLLQKRLDALRARIERAPIPTNMSTSQLLVTEVDQPSDDGTSQMSMNESSSTLESGLQRMFARQVIPSDLPVFTGKPEEWPIFISCYNNSTKACGFTNVENLMRLQRCLRGPARLAVGSKLLLPECVTQVIETLQLLYGRPELLISTLISQLRETPAPRDNNLNSLIAYGLAVQNVSDHMIAAGLESHLNNPCLLQEMISKLPTHLKLQWATRKQEYGTTTIATFSKYMSELVKSASSVTSDITLEQNNDRDENSDDSDDDRESIRSTPSSSRRGKRNRCYVCGESSHRVSNCTAITSMPVIKRWEIVNQLKLCPCCLNRHLPWPCKTVKNCDVHGCRMKHHPLLHSSNDGATTSGCSVDVGSHNRTILKYIPVTVYGKSKRINTFAFIDEGSSRTMLETALAEELEVDGTPDTLSLKWIDGQVKTVPTRNVTIGISEKDNVNQFTLTDVCTVSNLDLPIQDFDSMMCEYPLAQLPHLKYERAKPRLLIGLSGAKLVVPTEVHLAKNSGMIGFKCSLGWSFYGSL
ncbi:uncharacterized protein LOC134287542 [Aedes albopictus]|uniref:PHD-type domain-containing protein n=1 Tax=Aedes albopictus TaxID=7160 RepID=A0ABM1YEY0_AEDAL